MIVGRYKDLFDRLNKVIPKERLLHDALSTLAFGSDASFYRLIPKLIVKVTSEAEMVHTIKCSYDMGIPLTFRAAGTSLSGQAITDSVLVIASHGWKGYHIFEGAKKIKLQVGIKGGEANKLLLSYGKKIGPDPASIDSAMIGGIAANNASGMCCGTSENSYKTVADMRVILHDGTILDTADRESCDAFVKTHQTIIKGIENLVQKVNSQPQLKARIERKFKIKNTTGYSLNALVDYSNPIDVLKHLMIGSEGTLGFISDLTYNTVVEEPHKALALIIYPNIESACNAVIILKQQKVTAVEIMDRAALTSVEEAKGVPSYIKTLDRDCCALLVETKADNKNALEQYIFEIKESIASIKSVLPINFSLDPVEQSHLWKVRKEIFATVAGMRKSGSTPIIEDICFPIERLAEGTLELISLFKKHNYNEAVIFGHALEGNLHFVFNQDFQHTKEIEKYRNFMDDVVSMVVEHYDGSLKAEHGTGRNMAPFVEKEWGAEAYSLMKEIKRIFDPKEILNPGVILNEDKEIHLKNIKPIPSTRESVDRCMECGFCERSCVSEGLTLSPRQRIVVFKEMERLRTTNEEPHRAAELQRLYHYQGDETCATDGLCQLACPLEIDTGLLIKEIRKESHSAKAARRAIMIANNMERVTAGARIGLNFVHYARLTTGKKVFNIGAQAINKISGGAIPLWNPHFPKGASKLKINQNKFETKESLGTKEKVVYFPSCITRSMGQSKGSSKELELTQLTIKLLERAGYEVIYPDNINSLCCGMAFSSKGYTEAGKIASDKLEEALRVASQGGKYPILCDMSPCLYTMKSNFGERLKLFEPAEFASLFLLDKLEIKQIDKEISVFAVCSAKKMEVDHYLYEIARRCATKVTVIESNCCGFAGDRGFLVPELNKHGLRDLARQTEGSCQGYATSRTCEIGLSNHSGIEFSSILYLLEEASRSN